MLLDEELLLKDVVLLNAVKSYLINQFNNIIKGTCPSFLGLYINFWKKQIRNSGKGK